MIKPDKKVHLLAGFAVGIFPAIILPFAGMVVAAFAGLIKEYEDGHGDVRGTIDVNDWTATLIGGLLADGVSLAGTLIAALLMASW